MEDTSRKRLCENEKNKEEKEEEEDRVEGEPKSLEKYLIYDVLRIIFQELNGRDLANAAMVCRKWLEAANNEKRTRGPVCCYQTVRHWYYSMNCPKNRVVSWLRVKPALSLLISCFRCEPEGRRKIVDCHCKSLPSGCYNIKLNTTGIVLDNREVEKNKNHLLCMFLPDIPGLKIKTFVLEDHYAVYRDMFKTCSRHIKELKEFYQANSKDSEQSNCFLLFSNGDGRGMASGVLTSIKKHYPGDALSVWGGVASEALSACSPVVCQSYARYVGIAISGPINTWSIVVDKTYRTKEQVEQRMKMFRSRVRLKKHTVGFMFACRERGKGLYDERNVESSIFKSLFPDVPLIGCFGDGEFGENMTFSEPSKWKTHFYNESSTVFMILTYG